ncbi:MAG TPA: bacillithiol system redox-active protein YtxJ [Pyrinomonadaceae bacterium]|jgi:bacillithiol system protein YtxJ|nr:bacillithiol system redox-active protein YtxJ [Pyrinomonadaceae bacterium]
MAKFKSIETNDALDELFERSYDEPVIIFKHSNSCGISSHVMEMVDEVGNEINFVVVQDDRDISNSIADRTGHRHQSPQIFVIKNGKPVYHATHYGVDPEAIEEAINRDND